MSSAGNIPTEPFSIFVANAPLASPAGNSDMLALLQNGLIKRLPVGSLPGLTPVTIAPTNLLPNGTTSYSVLSTDYFVGVNNTVGVAVSVGLPSSPAQGRTLIFKDVAGTISSGDHITLSNGMIDGSSGATISSAYGCLIIQATGIGNNWAIISRFGS